MSRGHTKLDTFAVLLFTASTAYLLVRIVPALMGSAP